MSLSTLSITRYFIVCILISEIHGVIYGFGERCLALVCTLTLSVSTCLFLGSPHEFLGFLSSESLLEHVQEACLITLTWLVKTSGLSKLRLSDLWPWNTTASLLQPLEVLLESLSLEEFFLLLVGELGLVGTDLSAAHSSFNLLLLFVLQGEVHELVELSLGLLDVLRVSRHQGLYYQVALLLVVKSHSEVLEQVVSVGDGLVAGSDL